MAKPDKKRLRLPHRFFNGSRIHPTSLVTDEGMKWASSVLQIIYDSLKNNTLSIVVCDNVAALQYAKYKAKEEVTLVCEGVPPFNRALYTYLVPSEPTAEHAVYAEVIDLKNAPLEYVKQLGGSDQYRWEMWLVFLAVSKGSPCFVPKTVQLFIDPDGNWVRTEACDFGVKQSSEEHEVVVFTIMDVLSQAFQLMNCTNVEVVDSTASIGPSSKRRHKAKLPKLTYNTVQINPISKRRRSSGGGGGEPTNRLHICRGHFMQTDPDGDGLFGKGVYGKFWVPAHAKGSAKVGRAVTDYVVNT